MIGITFDIAMFLSRGADCVQPFCRTGPSDTPGHWWPSSRVAECDVSEMMLARGFRSRTKRFALWALRFGLEYARRLHTVINQYAWVIV